MAGMKFEYDEKGGTFYYFIISFYALILIPVTYYGLIFIRRKETKKINETSCNCSPCLAKEHYLKTSNPKEKYGKKFLSIMLIIGWIVFTLLAYKTSQIEHDFTEYDPYKILEIDREASMKEIKSQYRKLSKIHHPDKGGDHTKFMKIAKAYAALTDEESRNNWKDYGNPDGPGATNFGIALPKWIVEKQNSFIVLGIYALVFMIILPVAVGSWWYKSIQFTGDQVLIETTKLYSKYLYHTQNMVIKRIIMLLATSFEFCKHYNKEIIERESDNRELPQLMKDLPHLNEKNKEMPFCLPFSIKTRTLIHAHIGRIQLPIETLEQDKLYILKKCLHLVNEMVTIVSQLVMYDQQQGTRLTSRLKTVENCIKVSQMIVQGVWDNKSPFLQLPHIKEEQLRHFITKKRSIKSILQFASMDSKERRGLLRNLSDSEYNDVINVMSKMPYIKMEPDVLVNDEEDASITVDSIVTVRVVLTRKSMDTLFDSSEQSTVDNQENENQDFDEIQENDVAIKEKPIWQKGHRNKKKKLNKNLKKPGGTRKILIPVVNTSTKLPIESSENAIENSVKEDVEQEDVTPKLNKKKIKKKLNDSSSDESINDENEELNDDKNQDEDDNSDENIEDRKNDEEEDWVEKFAAEAKKENSLETKSKETFCVHCPYFPALKYEWWYLFVADKKKMQLISMPQHVTSLKDIEEVELKFQAPRKPGTYIFTVYLMSDSYIGFDQSSNIKFDVKEAIKITDHPQWNSVSEDEDDKDKENDSSESSDYDDNDSDA